MARFLRWIVWPWLLLLCAQAQAFQLSGTFSGIAEAYALPIPHVPPPPISVFDGEAVTGSFAADIPNPQFYVGGFDDFALFHNPGGTFDMSFNVAGRHFNYHTGPATPNPGLLELSFGPGEQSFSLASTEISNTGASFSLTGPPGSLFEGLDATTLHLDPTQSYRFQTSFAYYPLNLGVNVNVAEWHLDSTTPVPEPTTVSLLLLGSALLAGAARKRAAG